MCRGCEISSGLCAEKTRKREETPSLADYFGPGNKLDNMHFANNK